MTCIVGIAEREQVWIGGDSAGVGGTDLAIRADRKVFSREGVVMGFAFSFRMGQLLRYALDLPPRAPGDDLMTYMVTQFIEALRDTLRAGGALGTNEGAESGGVFMVGLAGHLYTIETDFQVAETRCGYDAIGDAADVALGALYATQDNSLDPAARILTALYAAQAHNAAVREPFFVVSTHAV